MTAVTRDDDVTTQTMVYRPSDGDGLSLVDLQRSGRRVLMRRTPLEGAGAVRQGLTVGPVSDPAVLEGLAAGLPTGPVAFTMRAGDQEWSATMTSLGNAAVRVHVEDLADVTLPLGSDDDTTTSAMGGFEVVAILILVMAVVMVAEMIVEDSGGDECQVEVKPGNPPPPTP